MAAFDYKALDSKGKAVKGVCEADSARQVRQQLREKGWTPLAVDQASERQMKTAGRLTRRGRLNATELAIITRQLATLIQSGIPIEETLSAVASQSEKPKVRSMMLAIRAKVLEGYTLADSFGEFPTAFPELYRSTVAAGEYAGHLDLVLNRLADYTEQRQVSRQKIQLAAIYPAILALVSVGILGFLLGYVVPDIIKMFINNGQELPLLTRVVLVLSHWVTSFGLYALFILILIFFGFRYGMSKQGFRLKVHRQILHLPFIAKMSRGINTARYASTLSILNNSGVPLVDAMRIAGEVLSNQFLKLKVADAAQKVKEGGSLYKSLEQTGYFPPMMIHMIASGEASGELGAMLERTASSQESELQAKIATMVSLFEPLMLMVMGGMVLVIVMAIMQPILTMTDLIS